MYAPRFTPGASLECMNHGTKLSEFFRSTPLSLKRNISRTCSSAASYRGEILWKKVYPQVVNRVRTAPPAPVQNGCWQTRRYDRRPSSENSVPRFRPGDAVYHIFSICCTVGCGSPAVLLVRRTLVLDTSTFPMALVPLIPPRTSFLSPVLPFGAFAVTTRSVQQSGFHCPRSR